MDQAFGSADVQTYYFPTFTREQSTEYLKDRPPRSFLIRRSATEPGGLVFVISYVKSTGEVKHHRLYYQDRRLTPQGSTEFFSSIFDLLHRKGFLGNGAFDADTSFRGDFRSSPMPSPQLAQRGAAPGLALPVPMQN